MKFIEEKYLEPINKKINKYASKHKDIAAFFNEIGELELESIQEKSFEGDVSFLNEIAFILSVIISIINHPHMINKGEEIVTRSELAPQLTNEMFQKTLRDSRLWTEGDNFDYVPENVYYYQQIDELKIYENIFIVVLINKISIELSKYNDYYVSLLHSYNDVIKSMKNTEALEAFEKIEALLRKLKHIKATYFYKSINRGLKPMASFHPTNILVKDRLYNFCYKFYRKMISFEDNNIVEESIRSYYLILLLKCLAKKEYTLKKTVSTMENIVVYSKQFEIAITKCNNQALELLVTNKLAKLSAKYLVVMAQDYGISNNIKLDEYDDAYAISAYGLNRALDMKALNDNPLSEAEIIDKLITTLTRVVGADKKIYSNYCPICKARNVNEQASIFECEECKSKYSIYKSGRQDAIWFIKIRR